MSMAEWELGQLAKGNLEAAEAGRNLREQYGEVPLPLTIPYRFTERGKADIVRFNPEARKRLEESGFKIFSLTGHTIATLEDAGAKFEFGKRVDPSIKNLTSRFSEVAINPYRLFIPYTVDAQWREQVRLIGGFSKKITKKIGGIEVVVGGAPDWAELTYAYLDATNMPLFGQNVNHQFTRTLTDEVIFGYQGLCGPRLMQAEPKEGYGNVHLAPLIVPKV